MGGEQNDKRKFAFLKTYKEEAYGPYLCNRP